MSLIRAQKSDSNKFLRVRVTQDLHKDLEALRREARTAGLAVDLSAGIEAALRAMIKKDRAAIRAKVSGVGQ